MTTQQIIGLIVLLFTASMLAQTIFPTLSCHQFRAWHSLCFLLLSQGLVLLLGQSASLAQPILIPANADEISLNSALDILEDKSGKITFEEIRSNLHNQAFKRYTGTSDPNFGHTLSVFWVKISMVFPKQSNHPPNTDKHRLLEISYPQLDNIRFYAPSEHQPQNNTVQSADKHYVVKQSGDMFPFAMRDLSYRMPVFRLPTSESLLQDTLTIYFRLESQGSMTFPMRLFSEDAMSRHIANEQFLLGMFYGILAIMIGYNLFVFFSLRDFSYLYYVLYILCYGTFLFIWNGLAFQYLWANEPLWHNRSVIVFMGLSGLSVFRFSQSYLDTKRITPRAHKFMLVVMAYFVIGMGLVFILPYSTAIRIMYGAPILTLPIILTVSVICIRKGYRPARYFLLAWILLLTTISMAALRNLNLLPSGALTIYGLQIGSALEIFLLSLGLADRINIIKQEKKAAEAEALRSTELLIETLRQSEQELEKKVRERTAELEDANEEISRQLEIQSEQSREIEIANTTLQEQNLVIEQERQRSEELLLNILPSTIATRLMADEKLIADRFDNVTVLFADLAGFTRLSGTTPPEELVGLLDTIFSEFDAISERFGLEKIKTIGDCYMAVSGLPTPQKDHAVRAAEASLEMLRAFEELRKMFGIDMSIRLGLHSGAVIAGVIGKKKFAYDLWGDTVNTASRMESQGVAGKIHISGTVIDAIQKTDTTKIATTLHFVPRGEVDIKGKGMMKTWFLGAD